MPGKELDTFRLADTESGHARRMKMVEAIACLGMSKAEAARHCGLSVGGINAALQDPRVQEFLAELRQGQKKRAQVTRDEVILGIKDAIDRARVLGEPRTEIAGWESINKMMGFNAPDRVVHELPEDTRELMEMLKEMSSDQIAEIAGMDDIIDLKPEDFKQVSSDGG